jgi:hypothetical protein
VTRRAPRTVRHHVPPLFCAARFGRLAESVVGDLLDGPLARGAFLRAAAQKDGAKKQEEHRNSASQKRNRCADAAVADALLAF